MKRLLLSMLLVLTPLLSAGVLYAQPASAVDVLKPVCTGKGSSSAVCQDSNQVQKTGENPIFGPSGILTTATRIIAIIIGFLSVIMVIAAGLRMMLASGDAQALQSARASLFHALAGVAVAALAYTIVGYILSKF